MRIRLATPADIPAIIALAQQAESAAHWSTAEYEKIVATEPNDSVPRRLILVIEDLVIENVVIEDLAIEDQGLQGFLIAKAIETEWEIENIAIATSARRRGLGMRLLSEFLEQVRRENAECVYLEVRKSNLAGRSLYKKLSFVEIGRRPSYYQHPQEDAIMYKLCFK